MKKISIVILNWNGEQLLKRFLPSVIRYSPTSLAEIIVADNASTDASVAMLEQEFPSVSIIKLTHNYGFAEGYNQALAQIQTPYVVLLNSDVEVTDHWLEAPLALLEKETKVACIQPKIRAWREKDKFEYAGAAGGFIDRFGYPYCRGRMFNTVEIDKGQYDQPIDVLWTTGACLFTRTALYKTVGGLDSDFFAHQEEIDFCWRVRSRGYRLVCTPASTVYHVGGATLKTNNPRKTFLNFRNSLLMLYKNTPTAQLSFVMRVRFILDYVALLQFILTGKICEAKAVWKARQAFHILKPSFKTKRIENLKHRTLLSIPEIKSSSLVISYYLKGKKHFSD